MATTTERRPAPVPTDSEDRERFAHIIRKEGGGAAAAVTEARVLGLPVEALCGKRWVPSRDPARFPLCPTCKERAEELYGS
ncbi:MAG TPA: DUF3039 domain-containing protein [Egibacteraceae bacterium]|jgi:hypothetical protein|nr:DUF3039 domain-containing protein [Egibacteraceae bacterium]